jgi:hypothetical protein
LGGLGGREQVACWCFFGVQVIALLESGRILSFQGADVCGRDPDGLVGRPAGRLLFCLCVLLFVSEGFAGTGLSGGMKRFFMCVSGPGVWVAVFGCVWLRGCFPLRVRGRGLLERFVALASLVGGAGGV